MVAELQLSAAEDGDFVGAGAFDVGAHGARGQVDDFGFSGTVAQHHGATRQGGGEQ